jgi:hypothetical protein
MKNDDVQSDLAMKMPASPPFPACSRIVGLFLSNQYDSRNISALLDQAKTRLGAGFWRYLVGANGLEPLTFCV